MKIKPIASGIDKVIINGICKESPIKYEENRIISKEIRTSIKNGEKKASVSFKYGEHEKINTFEVPFFGKIHQYKKEGIIQNTFFEKMKFGKMYFNSKLVLSNDFGQLYRPSTKQTTGLMPFRYVFNPNKALRSGSSFINFFNDLIDTAESFEIPELHINFDFEESISNYVIICLNKSRVHNDTYQNTKYFGFQQKAAVRHVIYNKKVEMLAKKKRVDHLPSTYHRYEIRLRDKKTVYDFITNVQKREKILSELVFLNKIPTLEEIQIASGCTLMRAKLVLLVIEDCNKLHELNKRAKKEVTEILRKLNVLNLAFDVENLLPYYSICDGGLLKEEVIPNTLIGETMVYPNIEEKQYSLSAIEDTLSVSNTFNNLSGEILEHVDEKDGAWNHHRHHSLSGEKSEHQFIETLITRLLLVITLRCIIIFY